ncbi:MAG: RNA ligase family protein, partial [Ignavibacteria bacterium]|nr:RNA ligase family protein [Ignavibacteria bacterium]
WQVIVKKDQFQPGQLVVFFEIDSILPPKSEYEFLRPRKFKIKTMRSPRLGVMSQGLLMPLDVIPEHERTILREEHFINGGNIIGTDVTAILNVQKYEPPLLASKNTIPFGSFPTHIVSKTDELRIQSFPELNAEMWGKPYIITDKYDGTSITIFNFNDEFGVCSRNLRLREHTDIYWNITMKPDLPRLLPIYCKDSQCDLALQGEICGKKIGTNPLHLEEDELFIFSVYDITAHRYLDTCDAQIVASCLGIKFVNVIESGAAYNYTVEEIIKKAEGNYYGTEYKREGIVIRPKQYTHSPSIGGQLSFKVINDQYLLDEATPLII